MTDQPPDPPAKTGEIIPFGTYKGQPAEVLIGDPQYVAWLEAQGWFRVNFPSLHTIIIIINNFAEPSETPAHNRLQARLLDRGFCIKLATVLDSDAIARCRQAKLRYQQDKLQELETEQAGLERLQAEDQTKLEQLREMPPEPEKRYGRDWHIRHTETNIARAKEHIAKTGDAVDEAKRTIASLRASFGTPPISCEVTALGFEVEGWDAVVALTFQVELCDALHMNFAVEAKPALGDDYPAVLRQIKHHGTPRNRYGGFEYRVLLVERLTATGATRAQIEAIFATSHIKLVLLAEVESVVRSPLDPGQPTAR
jgi:hypothetical protein